MFNAIKNLFDEMRGGAPRRALDSGDYRVAAAALLVHLAHADGELDKADWTRRSAAICSASPRKASGSIRRPPVA